MNKEKKLYEAPSFFIMEVKSEGVICASGSEVNPSNPFGGSEDLWILP